MSFKTIRKAFAAALTAFAAAFATAYANVGWPGWDAIGGMAIFAAVAGLTTWAVPNARPPLPESYAKPPSLTPAAAAALASLQAEKTARRPGARPGAW